MRPIKRSSESGNAFFIVMVGVVLFAALMFTFSRGARQGGNSLSEKQAEIAATELIAEAQKYQRAVSRILMKGCSENQISFDLNGGALKRQDDTAYNYTNANSPGNFMCHVYQKRGGNLLPYTLPADYAVDNSLVCAGCSHAQSLHFTATTVTGVGTDTGTAGSDLVLWMGRVPKNLCMEINDQLGITNPGGEPPVDDWNCADADAPFTGSYNACTDTIGNDEPALAGQNSFCVAYDTSGWTYIYMTVLHPR